jgi:hypothetical protein
VSQHCKYRCDRCGAEPISARYAVEVNFMVGELNANSFGHRHEVDLCQPCGEALRLFIDNGLATTDTPNLGLATTRELLQEFIARNSYDSDIDLDYRTVQP